MGPWDPWCGERRPCPEHLPFEPAHPSCPHLPLSWPCSCYHPVIIPLSDLGSLCGKGKERKPVAFPAVICGLVLAFGNDRFLSSWLHFGHLFVLSFPLRWSPEFPGYFSAFVAFRYYEYLNFFYFTFLSENCLQELFEKVNCTSSYFLQLPVPKETWCMWSQFSGFLQRNMLF